MNPPVLLPRSIAPSLRSAARLGVAIPVWFLSFYLVMAAWHPTFRHTSDAISTLGGIGQPRAMAWNALGFILPGVVIALFGFSISRHFDDNWTANLSGTALAISGLLMVAAGIFPTDVGHPEAWTNIVHEMSGWGSLSAFLAAGALTPWVLWSRLALKPAAVASLMLVFGTLAYQLLRPEQWWLGQRVGFACYFLWIALIGSAMSRPQVPRDASPVSTSGWAERELALARS